MRGRFFPNEAARCAERGRRGILAAQRPSVPDGGLATGTVGSALSPCRILVALTRHRPGVSLAGFFLTPGSARSSP